MSVTLCQALLVPQLALHMWTALSVSVQVSCSLHSATHSLRSCLAVLAGTLRQAACEAALVCA